jgi:hypothetical protein
MANPHRMMQPDNAISCVMVSKQTAIEKSESLF